MSEKYRDVGAEFLRQMPEDSRYFSSTPLGQEHRALTEEEREFARRSSLDTALED